VLTEVIADFLLAVTGFHTQTGNIADYVLNPSFVSGKIRAKREVSDVQSAFQLINIGILTSMDTPRLLNNFTHFVLDDRHRPRTTQVFEAFQTDLRALSATIDQRNKRRTMPCNTWNPAYIKSSVGV
jgi:hypothetical protein